MQGDPPKRAHPAEPTQASWGLPSPAQLVMASETLTLDCLACSTELSRYPRLSPHPRPILALSWSQGVDLYVVSLQRHSYPFPSTLLSPHKSQRPGETPFTFLETYLPPPVTPTKGPGPRVPLGSASASSRSVLGSSLARTPCSQLSSGCLPSPRWSLEGRTGGEEAGGPQGLGGVGAGPGRGGRRGDARPGELGLAFW